MRGKFILAMALASAAAAPALAQMPPTVGAPPSSTAVAAAGVPLATACPTLPVADACAVFVESAKMLGASYAAKTLKRGRPESERPAIAAFAALGYEAEYIPARAGGLQGTIDVFLVSRPRTNRLYFVVTGTESVRDWLENAKVGKYTARYADGQFYVPPAHAGFRRGMLSIINGGTLRLREFDERPLDCAKQDTGASRLARYLCAHAVADGSGRPIETVIVGHSRGAGIGLVMATALAGLQIRMPKDAPASVERQRHWPLTLHAIVGYAPPYAIYSRSDAAQGMKVPPGIGDQWSILAQSGIPARTFLFLNERDVVPMASLGYGRHFGHRFRIRSTGAVIYDGEDWGPDASAGEAHSNVGYCRDVLRALGDAGACATN